MIQIVDMGIIQEQAKCKQCDWQKKKIHGKIGRRSSSEMTDEIERHTVDNGHVVEVEITQKKVFWSMGV
jgi:hypothetical protein